MTGCYEMLATCNEGASVYSLCDLCILCEKLLHTESTESTEKAQNEISAAFNLSSAIGRCGKSDKNEVHSHGIVIVNWTLA